MGFDIETKTVVAHHGESGCIHVAPQPGTDYWGRHSGRKIYVTDERYALILCNVKGIQVNPFAMHALEVQFPRFNPNQIRLSSWMHCNRRRRQLSTH